MNTDLFNGIPQFVAVATEGSFSGAARTLGVTPAAVSKAIARLEEDLGVRLFNRTTRTVSITAEGQAFLQQCREAVEHVRTGRALMEAASDEVRGELRVSASPVMRRFLAPRVARFCARYPDLVVGLRYTDRFARLIDEQVDVAVRIGALEDSTLRTRRLFETRWVTVAAPAYLQRHGRPQTPDDLADHACLRFEGPDGTLVDWVFRRGARQPDPRLVSDDGESLIELAAAGAGITHAFRFMVEARLAAGELVEVLPDDAAAGPPVWLVWLPDQDENPRVRALVDFMVESS